MSEERNLLDHQFTLLVFRGDGFLTAIFRVRYQGVEQIDTRLEDRHIDRWRGKRRITVHAVMHRVELFQQIAIRRFVETKQSFELFYFCCHTFSFRFQIPAHEDRTSEERGPVRLSPNLFIGAGPTVY